MPIFRRTRKDLPHVAAEEVLWGTARREAASDRDDPIVHAGLVQHAFLLGDDERAICGFRPPVASDFGGRARVPQLALPGPDNPRCSSCLRLMAGAEPPQGTATETRRWPEPGAESTQAIDDDELAAPFSIEADAASDAAESVEEPEGAETARGETKVPRRSSARRAGRITVPQGRRSVLARLPPKLRGSAITADIDGEKGDLHVQSVRVLDDGTVRITLNQKTISPVDLILYVVSGHQRL
jgi:hypothetical protein